MTGITFWDGPDDGIAPYDYITEEDWTQNICDCCLDVPIPQVFIFTTLFTHLYNHCLLTCGWPNTF